MIRAARAAAYLAILLAAGPADGRRRADPPTGSVVYIDDGALWRAPLAEPDRAEKLLALEVAPALIRGLTAAADGGAVLIDLGDNAAWIDLAGGAAAAPLYLPCRAGRLSADGGRVLCAGRAGAAVVLRLRPALGAAPLAGDEVAAAALATPAGDAAVFAGDGALWRAALAHPAQREKVAPHAPLGDLSVAPDGRRAVGRYPDGEGEALYGFRLDGHGARRRLIVGAPIGWSADSAWLLVASGEAACELRAVGGEYKCWDDYRPLALAADGGQVLLARDAEAGGLDVYLAATSGVRPEKPHRLLESVLAATLVP
ncbi:MAG TPA: hypothetical protein VKZ63_10110 [Kofleriaceae bacterium]|nr:hypothetical protein [Kofleriaceae bacterium]